MAVLAALVLALTGCGDDAEPPAARAAARAFLSGLARGDIAEVCGTVTRVAAAELVRDFGGRDCPTAAAHAALYLVSHAEVRHALAAAEILESSDLPLSPAPYRRGRRTLGMRVVIDDPVVDARQAIDLQLREDDGRWRVDSGLSALFTLT